MTLAWYLTGRRARGACTARAAGRPVRGKAQAVTLPQHTSSTADSRPQAEGLDLQVQVCYVAAAVHKARQREPVLGCGPGPPRHPKPEAALSHSGA